MWSYLLEIWILALTFHILQILILWSDHRTWWLDFLKYICILLGIEGKNNKVLLKNFKLLRIIPKIKKIIHFFQKWGRGQSRLGSCDGPLVVAIKSIKYETHKNNALNKRFDFNSHLKKNQYPSETEGRNSWLISKSKITVSYIQHRASLTN